MPQYNVLFGAYVRAYGYMEFEAGNDDAAKTKAIELFKNDPNPVDESDMDFDNIAQPSIVNITDETGSVVLEAHDFSLNEKDACDYCSTDMRKLLKEAADRWGPAFADDSEVNGGDLVEWFGEWLPRAQSVLAEIERNSQ